MEALDANVVAKPLVGSGVPDIVNVTSDVSVVADADVVVVASEAFTMENLGDMAWTTPSDALSRTTK